MRTIVIVAILAAFVAVAYACELADISACSEKLDLTTTDKNKLCNGYGAMLTCFKEKNCTSNYADDLAACKQVCSEKQCTNGASGLAVSFFLTAVAAAIAYRF